jgi:NADPH:quinone reductase-like Zn-dependent oxidoreductase
MTSFPTSGLQLRSLAKSDGTLELSLLNVPTPEPAEDEVVIRVEGAPINPSDLGLLIGGADLTQATSAGSGPSATISAPIPPKVLRAMKGRLDESMAVGNEGAGVVVAAGASDAAQALLGKTVAIAGGAMFSQYRCVKAAMCLALPDGITAEQGASSFVNPLTALCMTETMRREGHTALVHTAAASNLGQMLNKICIADGIELVNIVRKPEHVELLRGIGAKHVVNSSSETFMADLIAALTETGATIAFDAIGGGKLAGQILTAMEAAANAKATTYSRYGSSTFKQVYIYGGLDPSPTELNRSFGLSWSLSGWLLTPYLQKIGFADMIALQQRVGRELTTTFASHYTGVISLADALNLDTARAYASVKTGEKYLINPSL